MDEGRAGLRVHLQAGSANTDASAGSLEYMRRSDG
jgi:hypothetical protein